MCLKLYLDWQHKLFLASGPRFKRLTATTMCNVSALILPKSQLHLDYNDTRINTLWLFSRRRALCSCKFDLDVMKVRPQTNADISS